VPKSNLRQEARQFLEKIASTGVLEDRVEILKRLNVIVARGLNTWRELEEVALNYPHYAENLALKWNQQGRRYIRAALRIVRNRKSYVEFR
jgi:hypothetical protein